MYPILITTKEKLKKNLKPNMNVSTLSILSEACNNILFHKKEVKEEKNTHTNNACNSQNNKKYMGPSWSWIYNFLCYQCLSPLRL